MPKDKENLIGKRGQGWVQLMAFFDRSRAYVAAHGVGLAQGALDQAIEHAKNREQFGQKVASFQISYANRTSEFKKDRPAISISWLSQGIDLGTTDFNDHKIVLTVFPG